MGNVLPGGLVLCRSVRPEASRLRVIRLGEQSDRTDRKDASAEQTQAPRCGQCYERFVWLRRGLERD